MLRRLNDHRLAALVLCTVFISGGQPLASETRILWEEPVDIPARNLLYGIGGEQHRPRATDTFHFVKEDVSGSNPKFTVKDSAGVKWKVKLGPEARPETAATRFVWAVGYITDEDYYLDRAMLSDVPASHLKRLVGRISADSTVRDARFERDRELGKKIGTWSWKNSAYAGTRELNGLRVLMALLNNWDVKDENNTAIRGNDGREIYLVSDLGATFGPPGYILGCSRSRGNLRAYQRSKFIRSRDADLVDFVAPARPTLWLLFNPRAFFMRLHLQAVGRGIPVEDARWMGSLLGRLSPEQIRDAFRAAGYGPEEVEAFARVVEQRIAALRNL